jgi:hypothetical protein
MNTHRVVSLVAAGLLLVALALGFPLSWAFALQARPSAQAATWDGVLADTVSIRGLTPRAEIPRTLVSREAFQTRIRDQLERESSVQRLALNTKLLTALGLLESGADLRGLLQRFRGNLVLGQYDPETRQLYVITAAQTLGPIERVTAAHEYTHALQDQHFDIQRLRPRDAPNTDRALAIVSLLEADATVVAERYAATALTQPERDQRRQQLTDLYRTVDLEAVPLVVREQSYFPYAEGPRFLRTVLGDDTIRGADYGAAVDRLLRNPPQSTAQILHPERYTRGQTPQPVSLASAVAVLGEDWRTAREGVLGELDHRLLLQRHLDPSAAKRAAEGWAGNGYLLLENMVGEIALVVRTRWDNPSEAREWDTAYAVLLEARYGAGLRAMPTADAQPSPATLVRLWDTPDGAAAAGLDDADTVFAVAPTAAQARRLVGLRTAVGPDLALTEATR